MNQPHETTAGRKVDMETDQSLRDYAYLVMVEFLTRYVGGTLDLTAGEMLGAIEAAGDGTSRDPAATHIWNEVWDESPNVLVRPIGRGI
jgi:hypothetical protein